MLKFWKNVVKTLIKMLDYADKKETDAAVKRLEAIQKETTKLADKIKCLEQEADEIEQGYFGGYK